MLIDTSFDDCIICYEEVKNTNRFLLTECGHVYCRSCFKNHMKIENRCASCRREIKSRNRILDYVNRFINLFKYDV